MMELRCMTETGRNRFLEYLQNLRNGSSEETLGEQFNIDPFSTLVEPRIQLDADHTFSTRYEMGEYLNNTLSAIDRNVLLINLGIWDWLTVLWFDVICPETNGQRKVRETARYIVSKDRTDYYRQLILGAWELYSLHGPHSRLFLKCPPYIHNDWTEQLASRQDIVTNKGMIEAIDGLYWDNTRQQPKRGATDRNRAGNVRRFVMLMAQLDLTYDLHAMSVSEILKLLPREFDIWKKK